jgi:hypothetical protein
MDADRLLRQVEKRLADLPQRERIEALDAIREEMAREKRRVRGPEAKVEVERERRLEAEILRDVLEAINREARLEETIEEVLKQLTRIVSVDSCSLALADPGGRFRIIAVRGFPDPSKIVGLVFHDPLSDVLRERVWPVAVSDVREDPRFVVIEGSESVRSWAGIPLVVEGEVIGLLCLDRHRLEPFDEEDLHRARALAFSAGAAIRKAQLLEQTRRYATLLERVVEVDQAVFDAKPLVELARIILEGAIRMGPYRAGLLVLPGPGSPRVGAATGPFEGLEGRSVPLDLIVSAPTRLSAEQSASLAGDLGVTLPTRGMYLVPLATPQAELGTLALLDPDDEPANDRLIDVYALRAALGYLHALRVER